MSAFLVLVRLRVLDVVRGGASGVLFMAFPLVLLAVVGLVFANGHPFEERRVVVVGGEVPLRLLELEHDGVVRADRADTVAAAEGRLKSRMAGAVFFEGERRLEVAPREQLFGRGLAAALGPDVRVSVLDVPRWGYVHYLFPGLLTFSTLLAGLFGMGYAMVRYRQSLFLKKLATTPLSRVSFVGAQIAARTVLVVAQLAALVLAAHWAFGLPLGVAAAAWLALLTVVGLATFMGVGFALACVVKSEGVMIDVINAITVPLVLFSEIFFPVDALPRPLPAVAAVLPSTQMVRLTREVLLYGGADGVTLGPGIAVLLAWMAGSFAVAVAAFRWHE